MSYYNISIHGIAIGGCERPKTMPVHGGGVTEIVPVHVTQHGVAWWQEKWTSLYGDGEGGYLCDLMLEDNGEYGEGIQLAITVECEAIVRAELPIESLDTLIEALTAIKRLRQTE